MKKSLLLLLAFLLLGSTPALRAQCYGVVHFDAAVNANGASTFTITTAHCNELIMISYDGWQGPGGGPVTVDGNNATYINTAFVYYYAVAETYAYIAPTAGVHTIVCNEALYWSPYWMNSAASFYVTGSSTPISIASLTNAQNTVTCVGGGTVATSITTTIPGSMIYSNFDCNNGQCCGFVDSWTGATWLNQLHEGNGIDQSEAYTIASVPGTYPITANCSSSPFPCGGLALLVVAIPPPLCTGAGSLTLTPTPVNPTCGNCNGSISIGVAGGIAPYTYSWSPNVSTNSSATGLCAGNYTVTVTDASCPPLSGTVAVTLVSAGGFTVNTNIIGNEPCNGNCSGSIGTTIVGGTAPYTYAWTPTGGTNATATGLCAGNYTVTVHDHNGCTGTASVTITQPPLLTATMGVPVDPVCNGGTGSATVTAAGGTPAYTYAWAPNGGVGATGTGLTAGSYTVTVTDHNGCTATASVTITQPTLLTATITAHTNILCNGGFGTATVTAAGGTPAYTYSWNPGGNTNANATNLTAGSYTVTVKDANGCTATASVTITQPTPLSVTTTFTPASCNLANGTATANVVGGTPTYTYTWTPSGGSNALATGLTAGSYTITVKDANGCTASASVAVTQPSAVTANITAQTGVSCNGGSNATATVTAAGGTPAYTYLWAPNGGNGPIGTGLSAGNYTVTVTDHNGCTATASVTITQPTLLTATMGVPIYPACNGQTGSVTVTAAGGTPAYTYAWAPNGGVGATGTGLSAGNYTVTVTDHNGCTATASVTITQPTLLTATITAHTNVPCNGGIGTATVAGAGGTPNYTYLWNPGGNTNANATNLTAGSYTVTVKDANGCTATASVTITQPTPLSVTATFTQASCNLLNGTATAHPVGGTPAYTYAWTPVGGTNQTATGISAGSYTVTVTDNNGCTASVSVTVTQPSAVTATITASTGVSCNGGSNATATVTAAGGTAPYTYLWNPNGGTGPIGTGLSAGNYTVTVTDHNGCSSTASVTITQPTLLTATMGAPIYPACNGQTGSVTVTAAGGTPAYTYAWAPNGGVGATGTGLSAGNYTVTVTDHNGCTATASVTITQPTLLTATITAHTNVPCNGGIGTATVAGAGGTPNYTYLWNPGGNTNANATNLTAGSYTVTVKDANGCTATASVTITQPTPLSVTATFTQASCNLLNGTATAHPVGGTPAYTYAWTPVGGTNQTATGISAGSYTVTVTDNNGCTASVSVTVTQPSAVTATITASTGVSCNGGSNATATVTAAGGTAPYTYLWNPNGGTGPIGTGLSAGNYTVTVTDNNGCSSTASVTITQPTLLTATMGAPVNILCNGGTGSATVTAAGGVTNYTYLWAPSGGVGATGTGLTAGSYTVTVTDAHGCTATASVTITQPTLLIASITAHTNVLCNGGTGSANATAAGGTPLYTYAWTPSGGNNANAINLTAGSYTVTVKDANGCTATASVTITQPTPLSVTATFTQASCNLLNGTATAHPVGGTPAYTYAWTPVGGTNQTATGISAGSYTVTVTDNNGCTASVSVTVTQPSAVTATITASTGVSCNGGSNATATVTAAGGTAPYTYLWNPNGGTGPIGTGLSAGNYTVTVTDNNGCSSTASVTITQPTLLTATMGAPVNILCNGGTGSATVTAAGGVTNYTYLWAPSGGVGATGTGLTAGSYTVTVTDAHGCTATASVTITQPTLLTATMGVPVNVLCNGGTGSATVTVAGGTPLYTYTWAPSGGNNPSATLSAGSYTVTVKDANGCTATASVLITQPAILTATMGATVNVPCNGGTGSATVNVAGGTLNYTYLWSPNGGVGATGTGLTAGSYTVAVTDAHGCSASASVTITQPALLTATMGAPNNILCNGGTGSATVTAAGGTLNYTYLWSPSGGVGATGTGLTAGSYTVTVTDAHGCTATASVTITEPTLLTATMGAPNNVPCNGGVGNATVTAAGGTLNYTYLWAPSGGTHSQGIGLTAGNYTVTVKDANGCTATASVTITQPLTLTTTATFTHASCNLPNGTATAHPAGGTTPYAYLWTPSSQTNATVTGLNAGSYTVLVTDANGCTASVPVTVTQPSAVTASIGGTTGVSCNGGNNGTIDVIPAGGSAPYNYIWAPGGNTNALGTGLVAGSYTMTVTDANGCTATAAGTITEPTALRVTASGPSVVCKGSSGNFTASASGGTLPYAYLWSSGATTSVAAISPPTPQTYTVTITDANGCTATAEVAVGFGPPLSVTISGQTLICTGGTSNLCASVTGGTGGNTYLWTPSNQTSGCISVAPTSTTTYTVTVTDNCGAITDATATVKVGQLPTVNMTADIYQGCSPLCIQFRNASQNPPGGVIQYVWTFGNGDTVQSESPIYCYKNSGQFDVTLTVSDSAGCSATMKKSGMITVYTPPVAAFTYAPQAISSLNPTVQFTNESKDQYGLVYYSWNFGDATDSTSKSLNAVHTYQDTGSYCANLVVMNQHGCTDTTTNCLVVAPAYTLYIPSAFSPNGDGVNDVFQPVGKYIKSFEMYIFDRWGMQLYHTTDITQGWKGTVGTGTNIQQEDAYVYKIIVTDAVNVQHSYVGNVSIIK